MLHHIHKKIYHGREKGKSDLETLVALKKEGVSDEAIHKAFSHHYPILKYQHKNNPKKVSLEAPKPIPPSPKIPLKPFQLKTFVHHGVALKPAVNASAVQFTSHKKKKSKHTKKIVAAFCILCLLGVGVYKHVQSWEQMVVSHIAVFNVQNVAGEAVTIFENKTLGYRFSYPTSFQIQVIEGEIILTPKNGEGEIHIHQDENKKMLLTVSPTSLTVAQKTPLEEAASVLVNTFEKFDGQVYKKEEITSKTR
jgi:hypothetical protein